MLGATPKTLFDKIALEELTAENDRNARTVPRSSHARTAPAAHSNSITNRYQVCGSVTEQGRAHRGANPTKRRSRSEPRSSSESEQEHHDPREVRAPTAEQKRHPFTLRAPPNITHRPPQREPVRARSGSPALERLAGQSSPRAAEPRPSTLHITAAEKTCAPIRGGGYILPSSLQ